MKRLSLFALFLVLACSAMAQVNRAKAEFLFEQGDGNLNPALADNSRQLTVLDSIAADFEKVSIQNRYVILHSYTASTGSQEETVELARRRADVIEKAFDSQLKTDAHVVYKPHYDEGDERVVLEVRYMGNYPHPAAERRVISERVYYRDIATGEVIDEKAKPIEKPSETLQPETPVQKPIEEISTNTQRSYGDSSFWGVINHNLAVRTNLLYDVALVPNLGIEWRFSDHISANVNWMYAWWSRDSKNDYWRIYGGDAEIRYWFGNKSGRKLTGHHVGAYGGILTYDVEWGGTGYMGEKWSHVFGLSYGYSLRIAKNFNLDFNLGLGYFGGEYYEYHPQGDKYYWNQTKKRNWFGPTKAEVSLVWLLNNPR